MLISKTRLQWQKMDFSASLNWFTYVYSENVSLPLFRFLKSTL